MSGSMETHTDGGVWGTKGMAAPGNVPSARSFISAWMDQAGNLWIFGGAAGLSYNDLWEYTR